jgi:predicted AlkP superfamily phosphohydrolase/phosphomutase
VPEVKKIAIIGLDCGDPALVFDRWLGDLPNLRRLCDGGAYGHLLSCTPPITVPAWSCMAASKDPGQLGIYGFRNRADYSYDKLSIATSLAVREPRLWDIFSARGRDNIILGVPGTFPMTRPPRGHMVTCFLSPDMNADCTSPKSLKQEIADVVGDYIIDVKDFRTDNKQWLLDQINEMTDKRFKLARHLISTKPWDLFWMVEMGTDRIHHGFWQFMDSSHHRYVPGGPLESAIHDYYVRLDGLIGELLTAMDLETTAVWVVSDHGAKCMIGGFCFNDWLIQEGYLTLKQPAAKPTKFDIANVDWSKTKAWGEGGYYGRCFLNVQDREPNGLVPHNQYEAVRDELIGKLRALRDHNGAVMGTQAFKPQDVYKKVNGIAPDLVVIFGNLNWRSVGRVGNSSLYTFENDTGPDDANHAAEGMYILSTPSVRGRGRRDDATLYDVAPTSLKLMGYPVPTDMIGRSLV